MEPAEKRKPSRRKTACVEEGASAFDFLKDRKGMTTSGRAVDATDIARHDPRSSGGKRAPEGISLLGGVEVERV